MKFFINKNITEAFGVTMACGVATAIGFLTATGDNARYVERESLRDIAKFGFGLGVFWGGFGCVSLVAVNAWNPARSSLSRDEKLLIRSFRVLAFLPLAINCARYGNRIYQDTHPDRSSRSFRR